MIFGLPLLAGAGLLGTAAFGIAKLAGASNKTALFAGLGVFGGSAALGALTAPAVSAKTTALGNVSGLAGGSGAATNTAALKASMGGGTSQILGASGGATKFGGALGSGQAALTGSTVVSPGFALTAPSTSQVMASSIPTGSGPIALGPKAYGATDEVLTGIKEGTVKNITRPGLTTAPTTLSDLGSKAVNFAKENPLGTGLALLTGGQMVRDLSGGQQSTGTVPAGQVFDQAEYDRALAEQRPRFAGLSQRAPVTDTVGLTPRNVYEEQEKMFAAKQGGLATIKLKEGGVNYLPSKSDHNEKDANNYVRAMGYVEDGSGNGDKDEDTMLAQLADGEFVSRADAILGAGIMAGANPEDFKEMRRKGAQFFYKQQDSFKRVYDLVNDRNQTS